MSIQEIAIAIMTWFTVQHSSWVECGRRYTPEEARERSIYYAGIIKEKCLEYRVDGREIDERYVLGIIAAESAFDRCAIDQNTRRLMGIVRPREKDVFLAASRKYRGLDIGIAQFHWPCKLSIRQMINPKDSLSLMISNMPRHFDFCADRYPKGIRKMMCNDIYWVFHHSPNAFMYKYYKSVKYQIKRMGLT